MQIIFPRAGEHSVNEAEIIFPFHRLDPVPADADENGVEVRLDELRPDRIHIFETGRGGVVRLAGQNQIRLAVNDQLRGGAALFQMRHGRIGCGLGVCGRESQRKNRREVANSF